MEGILLYIGRRQPLNQSFGRIKTTIRGLDDITAKGAARPPWIEWGPYLWTDGVKGRKDGFTYLREDLREDGLHPSDKGNVKISAMMLAFFKTDPATRGWFLK
jgi:hypothetical protein